MKLPEALIPLCVCPVDAVRASLPDADDPIWDRAPFRRNKYAVHSATRSVVFDWLDNAWAPGTPPLILHAHYVPPALAHAVYDCAGRLLARRPGVIAKLMLAELAAGAAIDPHVDVRPALTHVHRCHLAIVSDPRVAFRIEADAYYLEPGVAYEFDNTRRHGVTNASPHRRVHLICDILPADRARAGPSA